MTSRWQILGRIDDDTALPSVCPFKTSPCMLAPRAHVEKHVRVLPEYTGTLKIFTRRFAACHITPRTTHTNTHNTTQNYTQHHTEKEGKRDRKRKWEDREEIKSADKRQDEKEERRNYDTENEKCLRTSKSARRTRPKCFDKNHRRAIYSSIFSESSESDRVFIYLHDLNWILRHGEKNQNGFGSEQ